MVLTEEARPPRPGGAQLCPSGPRVPRSGARPAADEQRCAPEGLQGAPSPLNLRSGGTAPGRGVQGRAGACHPGISRKPRPVRTARSREGSSRVRSGLGRAPAGVCLAGSLAGSAPLCSQRALLSPHGWETRPASLPACTQRVSSLLSRTHPGTAPLTRGWPARSPGPVRPGRPSGPGPGLCNNASRAAPRTGQLGGVLLLSTPGGG